MSEDIKKPVDVFMDRAMPGEGQASVLAYAKGRLDAQKEFRRQMVEISFAEVGKSDKSREGLFKASVGVNF
jgi:hypothetical protein